MGLLGSNLPDRQFPEGRKEGVRLAIKALGFDLHSYLWTFLSTLLANHHHRKYNLRQLLDP